MDASLWGSPLKKACAEPQARDQTIYRANLYETTIFTVSFEFFSGTQSTVARGTVSTRFALIALVA